MNDLSVVQTKSENVISINHSSMLISFNDTLTELARLSDMVTRHLLVDMKNTEVLLETNPRVKKLHDEVYTAVHQMSEKFRGVKLICTRLGLSFPKDFKQVNKTQLTYFAERLATLKGFSVQFASGVLSISLLIEKEEDRIEYYSVDAVDAASGTILFPLKDYIGIDVYNYLEGISQELYEINTQYIESQYQTKQVG